MADRTVRSLEHLENSASTARVFNLRTVARRKGQDPEYLEHPVFRNSALNTSIIVKHRLRGNEGEHFSLPRRNATKILIPIQQNDLKLGARYIFIGQRGFEESLFHTCGVEPDPESPDHKTLRILDETPSLDPFLLREQLRRNGLEPARCYFEISPADTQRMFNFAQGEIEALVRMSVGESETNGAQSAKLAKKILANSADAELEPLRLTLQLDRQQYQEGIFCWKAFLYYKWQLADLLPQVSTVLQQVETIQARGPQTDEDREYLLSARENIRRALVGSCRMVKDTLAVYDAAYHSLTANAEPLEFRDFLLKAPSLFTDLGERLGAVEHIISFWRFRFRAERTASLTTEELVDMFMDFESSLDHDKTVSAGGVSRIVSPVIEAA
ncbi:MAG TPA: hypothetical protein VN805_00325 [Caulobacteraceae bacterium]|nr:hypothetical protein [Caulobacteraceae bacterium]